MLAKFSGLNPKGPYVSLEKEIPNFWVVLPYSIKRAREIRKFHVAVVQQPLRNVQKSVIHVQRCFLVNLNLLFLFCSLSPLQKLPTVVIQKFCYHGKVTSHISSLLNINLIFSWLPRRHIRTPRFVFLSSSTNSVEIISNCVNSASGKSLSKNSPLTYRSESLTTA